MGFNPKQYFSNYFKKKSIFGIVTDFLFVLLVVLMINPGTRTAVSSFFIKMTSLPPSTLNLEEQTTVTEYSNDWLLYDLDGDVYTYGDLNKKPVFLNLWATWCPPCVAELPSIKDLYLKYNEDVNFILVSNEDPATIRAFIEKNDYQNLSFYVSRDTPPDFESQSIPTTYVISKEGIILINKKGAARWNSDKMNNLLDNLIGD